MVQKVRKRKGNLEEVSFDKIYRRIKWLISEPFALKGINDARLAQEVIQNLYNK